MEENYIDSKRRQEILQNLQKEREKRKEQFELENFDADYQVTHSFRSETIARLVQERRNQDMYQLSKANLQESLKDEIELRKNIANDSSEYGSPQFLYDDYENFTFEDQEKPSKREVPAKKVKNQSTRSQPKEQKLQKNSEMPKQQKPEEKKVSRKTSEGNSLVKIKDSKAASSISNSEKELRRENFEKRIEELVKMKEESLKQREKEKKKKDEEEIKSCSFAPQVNSHLSKLSYNEKIEDRLLKLGHEHQKNREKLIKDKELQETSCSFIPKISENSANMIKNRQPIHERLEDLQKERQDIINKLRSNLEAKTENNFKPKINQSKVPSNRSGSIENQSRDTFTSKKRAQEEVLQSEVQNFTFTPQLASKPTNLKSFLDRQQEFIKKKEEKLSVKNQLEDTCTFKPAINSNSRIMAFEEEGDKFERMSKQEMEKRLQNQARREEDYYSKFSHEPKINPNSKLIARNSSVYESKSVPAIEEAENFSFKPKLETKKFKNVQSHYSKPDEIMHRIKEKEKEKQDKMTELKQRIEEKETVGCTFHPKIVELSDSKEIVLVPGFEKFMAWKELAKKQEEDKKNREFKVFGIKGGNSSITVPQPFNLAPDMKDKKIEKIKQEVDDQFNRECTFKPKTLETY